MKATISSVVVDVKIYFTPCGTKQHCRTLGLSVKAHFVQYTLHTYVFNSLSERGEEVAFTQEYFELVSRFESLIHDTHFRNPSGDIL